MKVWKRVCMIATAVTLILAGFSSTATIYRINPILAAEEEEDSTTETESAVWDGSTDTSWYDSEETVFHISTAEELAGLAALVNNGKSMQGQTIFLDADIILNDISNYENWSSEAPANKWTPIASYNSYNNWSFQGTLDGQGYNIKGLFYTGLFGYTGENSSVKNLTLSYGYIENMNYYNRTYNDVMGIGGLTGYNAGSISNCSNQVTISYSYSYNNYDVYSYIGGICGLNGGKIFNCTNKVSVSVISNGNSYCYSGGISGKNDGGEISYCMNNAAIYTESKKIATAVELLGIVMALLL